MKPDRRTFLKNSAIGTAGLLLTNLSASFMVNSCKSEISPEKWAKIRTKARERKRRIIMNNDGNDVLAAAKIKPATPENFLKQRALGLVGSQVDSIFYCTGVFNYYSQQSEESELLTWNNDEAREYYQTLFQTGTDPLKMMVDFGHQHNIEVFWSMRMNDTHDSSLKKDYLFCQWKKDHPEYLVGKYDDKFPYGANRWSSVNYDIPEVREKVYRILSDVCSRYDIDGIELDFFRHPVLFKNQMTGEPVTQEQCDEMTELIKRIHEMVKSIGQQRKKPILVAIRIPDSVGYCKAIGIDLLQWLNENYIDIITGADYFKLEPWENLASLGAKYKVPVYACLEGRRLEGTFDHPVKSDETILLWRGEALNAWEAGVNGIYTFNRANPDDQIFREIGDPEILKTLEYKDQTSYVNENSWSKPESWLKDGNSFVSKEIKKYI